MLKKVIPILEKSVKIIGILIALKAVLEVALHTCKNIEGDGSESDSTPISE